MKKQKVTKELLLEHKVKVELDENGQPLVYQDYVSRSNASSVYSRKYIELKCKHKHGDDKTYYGVSLHLGQFYNISNGKNTWKSDARNYPLHIITYVWFKGDIPKGYDVDHIDNNPLNNNPDNLQLLSRQDNLAKRKGCKNQYEVSLVEEFGEEYFKLNPLWKEYKANHHSGVSFRTWYYEKRTNL